MASMTAKTYLEKVAEICEAEDAGGRCQGEITPDKKGCPLWEYSCGAPTKKKDIPAVIKIVQGYKKREKEACPHCGRVYAETIKEAEIEKMKFCPYCGEQVEND